MLRRQGLGPGDDRVGDVTGSQEMRRGYHNRIGELRERSLQILAAVVDAFAEASSAVLAQDPAVAGALKRRAEQAVDLASEVDSETVHILALESPVARDLRVVLACRDVSQTGLLCMGLCAALAGRASSAGAILGPDLGRHVHTVSAGTAALLTRARAAWTALDPDLARATVEGAPDVRRAHVELLEALISLTGVPMDAALDLGVAARAYERLTDHAVEIAERVLFAVHGWTGPPAGT